MHLAVGDTVGDRLANGGIVKSLLEKGASPEEIITALFIRTLSRKPTSAELAGFVEMVAGAEKGPAVYEDIFSSLFSSTEFMFNH